MCSSIFVTPPGRLITSMLLHPEKAQLPILVTLSGISSFSSEWQALNADGPMVVIPSGSIIFDKLLHPEKAQPPILVMLLGISTLIRPLHPSNAFIGILSIHENS